MSDVAAEEPLILPPSFAQRRLWFLHQVEPNSSAYTLYKALHISGPLQQDALQASLNRIIQRHETLRTTFVVIAGQPMQEIAPVLRLSLPPQDVTAAELLPLALSEASTPFDLAVGPLLRATLYRLDAHTHVFLLTMHHIIADAWSVEIFFQELAVFYAEACKGGGQGGRGQGGRGQAQGIVPTALPELPVQYADYALWEAEWLRGTVLEEHLAFWRTHLSGAPALLDLPTDRPRPRVQSFHGMHLSSVLPHTLLEQVNALSSKEGVTLFMTLLAAFQVVLRRYTGQDDIVVGIPFANRMQDELAGLIGFFANTLAVRVQPTGSFHDLLRQVRDVILAAYDHQELPFEKLVEDLQPERTLRYNPLVQVAFSFYENSQSQSQVQAQSPGSPAQWPELTTHFLPGLTNNAAKFDLALLVGSATDQQHAPGLLLEWEYNTDLFDASTIQLLAEHYLTLLQQLIAHPEQSMATVPMLTEAEQQVRRHWNDTHQPFAETHCVHHLVEAHAAQTPEAIALVGEQGHLTYQELNLRATTLAQYLQEQGVGPERVVGICMERSFESIIAGLAVLKAGGAYLPLDPSYPPARLAFMLQDAHAALLLTQQHLLPALPADLPPTLCLNRESIIVHGTGAPRGYPGVATITAQHLAYLIYTSGSTGQPKGVQITHQSLLNLVFWHQRTFAVTAQDRASHLAGVGFDAAVWEIWPYLAAGACLVLPDEETRLAPEQLQAWLLTQRISLSFVPTPLAEALLTLPWPKAVALRCMLTGGDRLRHFPPTTLPFLFSNNYGPTEHTVVATSTLVHSQEDNAALDVPTIGRPIANTRAFVLDAAMQPVPIGVPGELYIGGVSLARGYVNRPDLTSTSFTPDPFSGEVGARLYRTGDTASYLPDGSLKFLGRSDAQVKLRGFRIELGEIEVALATHPAVQESLVLVATTTENPYLVAYVVPQRGQEAALTSQSLRDFLSHQLPDYMLPAAFVLLEAMPLTANGKVDRRALPAVEWQPQDTYQAPSTPIEEVIAGIWTHVLQREPIGVTDNFFALGGHSLLAVQVISRLRQTFQVDLPLHLFFETPTVARLAASIEAARKDDAHVPLPPLTPLSRANNSHLPLSFAQERLWFLDQLTPNTAVYTIPAAVRLAGPLNVVALQRSIQEIVRRHESLRTTFSIVGEHPVQLIAPPRPLPLPAVALLTLPQQLREAETVRVLEEQALLPFTLNGTGEASLFRALLLRLAPEEHVLLLVMHHSIADAWSLNVFYHELSLLYAAFAAGSPSPLHELRVQYADVAAWQRTLLQGELLENQVRYWRTQLSGTPALLNLPTDRPRPVVQTFTGAGSAAVLPAQLTAQLKALSQRENVTLFMTLLAAFQVLLYRYTGQEDIVVGTPIAHRTQAEFAELIGFFINTLALRVHLSGHPSFQQVLHQVREVALGAYAHQDLPFEKVVDAIQPERTLSYSPLFQVMFTLQNDPAETLQLPHLSVQSLPVPLSVAKFDLTLFVTEKAGGLDVFVEYNTDLFEPDTIERFIGHYQCLLEGLVSQPEQPITTIPLLTTAERQQLLSGWNATQVDYAPRLYIHDLFAAQAQRTPDAVALVFEQQQVTYSELDRRSNQLAHSLQALGVGPEILVGICMERSIELVIGLLGILKAGAAYVPLDPAYPPERLTFMLSDAHIPVILTQQRFRESLPSQEVTVLCLDSASTEQEISTQPAEHPRSRVRGETLAYVIYTSGSTGKPKGAMNTHQGLYNRIMWMQEAYQLRPDDRVMQKTPYSFDVSVWEFFWPLIIGAPLIVARPDGHRDSSYLVELIKEQHITTLHFVPSMLRVFLEEPEVEDCSSLRQVMCSGEALSYEVQERFFARSTAALQNLYGPTEASIDVMYWTCERQSQRRSVPIGYPIANTQIYLLDARLQPVPIGVLGELHIAGVGLARGYLRRPDLTAERFIPDPFSAEPGGRLYKTGDLARYLPDGAIEYLGRLDYQVKLRGFRIELGEIEVALATHPAVQESLVLIAAATTENPYLVAYVVPQRGQEDALTSQSLRDFLSHQLPDYMLPAAFVLLETMPLTANGKVDRRALPAVEWQPQDTYQAPSTPIEEVIAGIWTHVLQREPIGVTDNFFALGGHSLRAVQVISRVRQTFQVDLPLQALFETPTVAGLAQTLLTSEIVPGRTAHIAKVRQQIDSMSANQIRARLQDKQTP